jgi:hypothetical protein
MEISATYMFSVLYDTGSRPEQLFELEVSGNRWLGNHGWQYYCSGGSLYFQA